MKALLPLISRWVVTSAALISPILAQDTERRGPSGFGRGGGLGLETGDSLPNVGGVDEVGRPVDLRKLLDGQYAVIVFGCLT